MDRFNAKLLFASMLLFGSYIASGADSSESSESSGSGRFAEANRVTVPEVFLSNGNFGRLQVLFRGEIGTVCNDQFDQNANGCNVVCKNMFGYRYGVLLNRCDGPESSPIWLDDVECIGDEEHLFLCSHSFVEENCGHEEDTGCYCCDEDATCGGVDTANCGGI